MSDSFLKPQGSPSAPGMSTVPTAKNFAPKGLAAPVGMPKAAAAPVLDARARADQMIADSKARRETHRQNIDARRASLPTGLLR